MKLQWNYSDPLKFQWNFSETSVKLQWITEVSMKLQWNFSETSVKLHWNTTISIKLQWNFSETIVKLLSAKLPGWLLSGWPMACQVCIHACMHACTHTMIMVCNIFSPRGLNQVPACSFPNRRPSWLAQPSCARCFLTSCATPASSS